MRIHGPVFAYVRSIKLGRMSGKVDMVIPYAWLSGNADFQGAPVSREVHGFGDPRLSMTVNFVGAPAMVLSDFSKYRQNIIVGASLKVFMPLGQYDPQRLVNIGTNRFMVKPELGVSKTLGPLFLELAASMAFFTVNHDFVDGWERTQDPLGAIQGHAIYNFTRAIWLSLDGTYYWGGRTKTAGVIDNDLQRNTRLGLTFSLPLGIHQSIKLYFSTGVSTRTGSDFDALGLVWQYRWGKDFPQSQ
ncbi:MAG: transporter [Bacteroidales bacterium]